MKKQKSKSNIKSNLQKNKLLVFILTFSIVGVVFIISSFAATPASVTDFSEYYPNISMHKTHYLSGNNYTGSTPAWAVLWFDPIKASGSSKNPPKNTGSYKMYNSNPAVKEGKCHWDQFNWTTNTLLYSQTQNKCGKENTDIKYSPGITYLPRKWDGKDLKITGKSAAKWYESGVLKCSGENNWVTEVFATPVELAKGVKATHVRSTQTTSWTDGPGSSTTGCAPGQTSHYQENLYFVTDLPIYGSQSVAPGLKRSVGGSLDFYEERGWDWDVWFDNWKELPKN